MSVTRYLTEIYREETFHQTSFLASQERPLPTRATEQEKAKSKEKDVKIEELFPLNNCYPHFSFDSLASHTIQTHTQRDIRYEQLPALARSLACLLFVR